MSMKALHPAGFRIIASLLTAMVSSAVCGQSETDFESEFAQSRLIHTADAGDILVVPFAQGLANPFDLAFRHNGDILVTERYTGQLRVIREGVLQPNAVAGVPDVYSEVFRAGLMSVALHPDNDALVFLSYTKPIQVDGEREQTVALARGTLDG
ncbi:MAG: PQQ-dependent sugar dehydrogenase, partial [Pseudomonadota bacterium]|nr:PQQ-dependent sugar dehydrogenase [Pseudomonadota bacterium]